MYCVASSAARYELSPRSPIAAHPFAFATESRKQKRKQKQKHKTRFTQKLIIYKEKRKQGESTRGPKGVQQEVRSRRAGSNGCFQLRNRLGLGIGEKKLRVRVLAPYFRSIMYYWVLKILIGYFSVRSLIQRLLREYLVLYFFWDGALVDK